jgi:ribose transport system ATP-binding protein
MGDDIPLLSIKGLSKRFPNGTVALRGVDLSLQKGVVHGLLGANGAGKSTLIKILSGAVRASGGSIEWKGAPLSMNGPSAAIDCGIATIHQHIPLAPALSVLENVFLRDKGWSRRSATYYDRYRALCDRVDYDLDPDLIVETLSIGQRQMVAILAALAVGADLIVMDEPTASLADEERELVYRIVRQLTKQENKAILFVSHFLDEVIALTDRVSVLRDGAVVLLAETADLDEAKIAEAIVGREVAAMERAAHKRQFAPPADGGSAPLLELRDLGSPGAFGPVSLMLAHGEVIGVAGLLGSGRSSLIHAIFGADPHATGTVLLEGRTMPHGTGSAVSAGIALVPEDRAAQGLIPSFEIWRNTTLPDLSSMSHLGLLPPRDLEIARGASAIERLRIKARSPDAFVTQLSGGNAQKVVVGKWLSGDYSLFLLDEPTAGIDIGAKTDILKLVRALAEAGKGVVMVSSEFEELIAVCDRILVLRDGKVVGEVHASDTNEHELVLMAGGGGFLPPPPAREAISEGL